MVQIKIERIGDDTHQLLKGWRNFTNSLSPGLGDVTFGSWPTGAWCAEITGTDPKYKFARIFLRANVDYTKANKTGSRGIYAFYNLEEGRIYDISDPVSWKHIDRFFARVEGDDLIRMTKEEVLECLRSRSA